MNIKKQLKKIKDAFEVLEISKEQLENELLQYQRAAHKFVKFELPDHMAREEFKELLRDTTFIGGNFSDGTNCPMEKIVDDRWIPIIPDGDENACQSTYDEIAKENERLRDELHLQTAWRRTYQDEAKSLREENDRLREELKWHNMDEFPIANIRYLSNLASVDVIIKDFDTEKLNFAWYSYFQNRWIELNQIKKLKYSKNTKWCYIPEDKDGA